MRKRLLDALRQTFRPEFLNRVDDIIVFNTLRRSICRMIIDLQLQRVEKLLARARPEAGRSPRRRRNVLMAEGYDPAYGARPMRRAIQRLIQDPLALQLLEGDFLAGDTIVVDATR